MSDMFDAAMKFYVLNLELLQKLVCSLNLRFS